MQEHDYDFDKVNKAIDRLSGSSPHDISFDKDGAEMLFSHLSLRAGRKSTIITTNLSFERWSEIFGDPVLTAAMVDRLTHKTQSPTISFPGSALTGKEIICSFNCEK